MAALPFQPGDTVCLKSGGPRLTVRDISSYAATCIWFDQAGEVRTYSFAPATLAMSPDPVIVDLADKLRASGGKLHEVVVANTKTK